MASAILPSRNDARSSDFRSKFTNGSLNFTRLQKIPIQNPNPNPNGYAISNARNLFIGRDDAWKNRQLPPSSAPPANNSVPASSLRSVPYRYITFRVSSYTRRELNCLKKRLISDLERVRILRQFVSPAPAPVPTTKSSYHEPPPELPPAPEVHSPVKERERKQPAPEIQSPVKERDRKRTKRLAPVRDAKKRCGGRMTVSQRRKLMMRECGLILGKLMKHKHGWVFNTPVNAVSMKLYDYHNIVKRPMDLGTIKSKLAKNEYESPQAFATDVRLTFENAMVYNGKGSEVFDMAERLLVMFEDMFRSSCNKFDGNKMKKANCVAISVDTPVVIDLVENRPLMTAEEKAELAARFNDLRLGRDGLDQISRIVKKGAGLERAGDEIELDLAVLDNETLWELHSFINRNVKNGDVGEEDVDIGEEIQVTNFPSVVIEKDGVNGSCSSSGSGSDSSSGSGSSSSDSGSASSCKDQEVNSTPKGVVP